MGSAASTAYKLGQETSGSASVGAGLGGIATAAGGAASQGMRSAASSITSPIRESAARGQQAAWDSARTSPAPASAGASGSASGGAVGAVPSDSVPAWARNLRAEQTARHRRHLAMQTVKDGDRGGGAANPDLSEKE